MPGLDAPSLLAIQQRTIQTAARVSLTPWDWKLVMRRLLITNLSHMRRSDCNLPLSGKNSFSVYCSKHLKIHKILNRDVFLYFSTATEPFSKHSLVKCLEHTTECCVGVHFALLCLTTFSHFFLRLASTGELLPQKVSHI